MMGCNDIMIKKFRSFSWLSLILLLASFQTSPVASICEQVITTALEATNTACAGMGRNQACYGNHLLEAAPQFGIEAFNFDDIGDVIDITGIESLRLSAMDMNAGIWGVALMRLQANIPHQLISENVTMVLFGDVQIQNEVQSPALIAIQSALPSNVNIRRYPERDAYVLGTLRPDEIAIADGRLEDGSWLHVRMLETNERGWVFAGSVDALSDASVLRVVDIQSAEFGPMQAFYLQTGEETTGCAEAPENGVLIQTPDGVATVDLWINEVKIRLGSTAYVQAQGGGEMTIQLIEGSSEITALGVDQVALAGTELNVPMSDSLQPAAPPSLPQPYDASAVAAIPVQVLDRPVDVAPPLDANTAAALNNANQTDVETPTPPPPTHTPTMVTPTSTPRPLPTLTPSPRPTNTPAPTNTPRPTNTLAPTNTPRPTNTLAPTDTPEPTNTPRPTATDTDVPTVTPVPTATDTDVPTLPPVPTATDTDVPTLPPPTETPLG
jgi:hypothetical protein